MCEFCRIIDREASAWIVYESEKVIAFLDIEPIHEGHILIVPKVHEASIDKIPETILSDVIQTAQKVVAALRELYGTDGYGIMQNGGRFCDFGHAHFHVFPRYENDGFGFIYPEGEKECSDVVAKKLKKSLWKINKESVVQQNLRRNDTKNF